MNRRQYLASVGGVGVVGLAGCIDSTPSNEPLEVVEKHINGWYNRNKSQVKETIHSEASLSLPEEYRFPVGRAVYEENLIIKDTEYIDFFVENIDINSVWGRDDEKTARENSIWDEGFREWTDIYDWTLRIDDSSIISGGEWKVFDIEHDFTHREYTGIPLTDEFNISRERDGDDGVVEFEGSIPNNFMDLTYFEITVTHQSGFDSDDIVGSDTFEIENFEKGDVWEINETRRFKDSNFPSVGFFNVSDIII